VVGLDEPGADDRVQFRREHFPERDQRRAGLISRQRPVAGHRGVIAGQRVIGAAEQQQVHRTEEQERRVLPRAPACGQLEELAGVRDGPAERAVQRRGGEFGGVLERCAYRAAIHELSLTQPQSRQPLHLAASEALIDADRGDPATRAPGKPR